MPVLAYARINFASVVVIDAAEALNSRTIAGCQTTTTEAEPVSNIQPYVSEFSLYGYDPHSLAMSITAGVTEGQLYMVK